MLFCPRDLYINITTTATKHIIAKEITENTITTSMLVLMSIALVGVSSTAWNSFILDAVAIISLSSLAVGIKIFESYA